VRILLGENLPHKLQRALAQRDVVTVGYMAWNGLKNGALPQIAEENGIDVLVTGDTILRYEQSFKGRSISVIVLSAQKWTIIRGHMASIKQAIDSTVPGSFLAVDCGVFRRERRIVGGGIE
jgi:hypothetical protein